MEFSEVVRRRRMVRAYDPDRPVPQQLVERLLEHAIRAPSAGFSQGWDFLVLRSPEERRRFWQASTGVDPDGEPDPHGEPVAPPDPWLSGMRTAPVLVVALSNKGAYLRRYAEDDKGWTDQDEARWPVPYWDIDTGMAALLMLLTAVDEGLAGCFFGVPPEHHDAFRAAFGVPADRIPVGVVSVGYPASDRRSPSLQRGRRQVGEVAHSGRFGVPFRLTGEAGPAPGCRR